MADKLIFELVSPSALLASEEVDMVVVPGAEGDFGVLAGHAPVLSNLRAGVVDIHNDGQVTKSLFVEGGFAEAAADENGKATAAQEVTVAEAMVFAANNRAA